MNCVSVPSLRKPAATWMMPIRNPITKTFSSAVSGTSRTVSRAPARMIEIVLVGPKTRCREPLNNAQKIAPTMAVATTAAAGRPTTRAKPMDCGMVTMATIAPATASAFSLAKS